MGAFNGVQKKIRIPAQGERAQGPPLRFVVVPIVVPHPVEVSTEGVALLAQGLVQGFDGRAIQDAADVGRPFPCREGLQTGQDSVVFAFSQADGDPVGLARFAGPATASIFCLTIIRCGHCLIFCLTEINRFCPL